MSLVLRLLRLLLILASGRRGADSLLSDKGYEDLYADMMKSRDVPIHPESQKLLSRY